MEDHYTEYKDYSNVENKKNEINKVKEKIIKEIIAFANSDGGKIVVGINKFGVNVIQPEHILKILENDTLCNSFREVASPNII